MFALRLSAAAVTLGMSLGALGVPSASEGEGALREELQQAVWPADIVRLADQYLSRFLSSPSFQPAEADGPVHEELRRAALGDAAAAVRLARRHQRGDGLAQDTNRCVGWLQHASMLGDERASYGLALHFRRDAQPVQAARYEARAVELGLRPPRDLDHVRK